MRLRILGGILLLIAQPLASARAADRTRNSGKPPEIQVLRTPEGGVQPQIVVGRDGTVHMVYLAGPDNAADVYYMHKGPRDVRFSAPMRVNNVPGSAIAIGSVRGAQIALGRGGRVHVAWLGSDQARPRGPANKTPMLYTRMNDAHTGFEPERNVMQFATGLDGGGSVAADPFGDVYVVWHGNPQENGETHRQVWVAISRDEGNTFEREIPANSDPTGACGCCGLRAFADDKGTLYILYRAAKEEIHRDMYLLVSSDRGKTFKSRLVAPWELNACPMSTDFIAQNGPDVYMAWQTEQQVYFSRFDRAESKLSPAIAAPGEGNDRKHPVVVSNSRGQVLFAWTAGTGWKRGGRVSWQVYDDHGQPTGIRGTAPDLPVWDTLAAFARPDGGFTIVY